MLQLFLVFVLLFSTALAQPAKEGQNNLANGTSAPMDTTVPSLPRALSKKQVDLGGGMAVNLSQDVRYAASPPPIYAVTLNGDIPFDPSKLNGGFSKTIQTNVGAASNYHFSTTSVEAIQTSLELFHAMADMMFDDLGEAIAWATEMVSLFVAILTFGDGKIAAVSWTGSYTVTSSCNHGNGVLDLNKQTFVVAKNMFGFYGGDCTLVLVSKVDGSSTSFIIKTPYSDDPLSITATGGSDMASPIFATYYTSQLLMQVTQCSSLYVAGSWIQCGYFHEGSYSLCPTTAQDFIRAYCWGLNQFLANCGGNSQGTCTTCPKNCGGTGTPQYCGSGMVGPCHCPSGYYLAGSTAISLSGTCTKYPTCPQRQYLSGSSSTSSGTCINCDSFHCPYRCGGERYCQSYQDTDPAGYTCSSSCASVRTSGFPCLYYFYWASPTPTCT